MDHDPPHCPRCDACLFHTPAGRVCPSCALAAALGPENDFQDDGDVFPRPFGAYELLGEVGRGGMGLVFRARQLSLNRIVALKVLLNGTFSDDAGRRRFHEEAETAARLQHPNIVAVHEVGQHDGVPYLTMDLVDGPDLACLSNGRPQKPQLAARLVRDIAMAVQAAHDAGVLHRDLKPGNVLVGSDGRPRVTDFGLAKCTGADLLAGATVTGHVLGSPSYVSPEQAAGKSEEVRATTDIYGLGAILYQLVTGRAPFVAATPTQTLRLVLETQPVSPRQLSPGLPRDLQTVCLKCLQKDPRARYATASAVAEDLERFLENRPILARPISPLAHGLRWCRAHPVPALLTAGLVVALMAVAVVSKLEARRTERARALAQEAERAAVASRGDAEKLMTWLLDDLCEDIKMSGRRAQVVKLARQAVAYYENLPRNSRSDDTERRHGKALVQLGSALEAAAGYGESEQPMRQAVEILERLYNTRDHSEATLVCLVEARMLQGTVQVRRGESRQALESARAALDAVEPPASRPGASFEVRCSLAWALRAVGFAWERLGEVQRATGFLERAALLHRTLVKMPEADSNVVIEAVSSLLGLNRVLSLTEVAPSDFRAQIEESTAAVQRLVDQGTGGLRALAALARLQDALAARFMLELNPSQSWHWRLAAAVTWERCHLLDPDQAVYRFNIVFAHCSARYLQAVSGDVAGAVRGWRTELDECSRSNGPSFSFANVAGQWRYLAIWLADYGDREGARHALAQQRDAFARAYGRAGFNTTYYRADQVRLLTATARVALLVGDTEAARRDAARACSLMSGGDLGMQSATQRRDAESVLLWAAIISGSPLDDDIRPAAETPPTNFGQRCEYGDRVVPLAILLARADRRDEAKRLLAPALEFFRRHLAENLNHSGMLQDLSMTLYAQALAEPAEETSRRTALLQEAAGLIGAMTEDYRALFWTKLLQGWIRAEQGRVGLAAAAAVIGPR